jgi:hypothetical protein
MRTHAVAVVLTLCAASAAEASSPKSPRTGSLAERVAAHRAVEGVLWSHRTWPQENPGAKPSLDAVLPPARAESDVVDGLRKLAALERLFGRTIRKAEVQAEIERIARSSKMPERLREIQAALGDDPDLFGDVVARPLLADRLLRGYAAARGLDFDAWWRSTAPTIHPAPPAALEGLRAPAAPATSCTPGTWSPMLADEPPAGFDAVAVWTGSELLLWGLYGGGVFRYDPVSDSWEATRAVGEPPLRSGGSAFWTGTEMLVAAGSAPSDPSLPPVVFFNPTTDSWRTGTAPPAGSVRRSAASIVSTGTGVIIWGGQELATQQPLQTGLRYGTASDAWSATSVVGAPSARSDHAAVWTGSTMVVWGGKAGFFAETNTGGRYDPATDSWTATNVVGAPVARSRMSSVWTGSKMLVWAGQECDEETGCTDLDSGGRYDPAADAWQGMPNNAPAPRSGAPAVWTGSSMIVYGGLGDPDLPAWSDGARYVESSNKWFDLPSAGGPGARVTHALVWTGSDAIVWGGQDGSTTLDSGFRYNLASDAWSPTHPSNRPLPRAEHSTVWTGSELLIWGGTISGTPPDVPGGRYDPALDAWTPMSTVNQPGTARYRHTAVWTGIEMIVWGGNDIAEGTQLAAGGRYAPASDVWTPIPDAPGPAPRADHTAVWTGTRMLVWGGRSSSQLPNFGDGWSYAPGTGTWSPISSTGAPEGRATHVAAWTGSEMIVWGGLADSGYERNGARYRPSTDTWAPMALAPQAPIVLDAVWNGQSMIEVGEQSPVTSGAVYDAFEDRWHNATTVGQPSGNSSQRPGVEWACGGLYWIGTNNLPNAVYFPGSDAWSPVPKNPSQMWLSQARDVVAAGSRVLVWNGTTGEVYCACAASPPAPAVALFFGDQGQRERIVWQATPFATGYDLIRGNLGTLRATAGDFTAATQACLANDEANVSWLDADPVPASGLWYLVRGMVGASPGSYDSGNPRQIGSRDAEIAAAPAACP